MGNAWSFLLCWLGVRSVGGRLVLRIEDIDPDRSKPEYVGAILRDLEWLGIDWDEGPDLGGPHAPYFQSARRDRYAEILEMLSRLGHTYPCYCTRKELKSMASAPHAEDAGPAYPGTCLNLSPADRMARESMGRKPAFRLRGSGETCFEDLVLGSVLKEWADCGGDFPVRRSDGVVSYQLAVAVDDMDQEISLVVRGADILLSTPRQIRLIHMLGGRVPQYAHVPLMLDHKGKRLAKRHQSLELRTLRESGVKPKAVIGFLAQCLKILPQDAFVSPSELVRMFSWQHVPQEPVTLDADFVARMKRFS